MTKPLVLDLSEVSADDVAIVGGKCASLGELFRDFEILHYHETSRTDDDAGEHHRRTAEIIAKRIR